MILTSVLWFATVTSVIVFVHELGHFFVARLFKVKVETFSIGLGKALFKLTDKNGTTWKIGWLPLGGYVKMLGDIGAASTPDLERLDAMTEAEKKMSFHYKELWQKALIVFAGPFANYLLALVLFAGLVYVNGLHIVKPEIAGIMENSPASAIGLEVGDEITAVNGKNITNFSELHNTVILNNGTKSISLTIKRESEIKQFEVTPKIVEKVDPTGTKVKVPMIGVVGGETLTQQVGLLRALFIGVEQAYDLSSMMLETVWQMVTKTRGLEDLGGPIRIAQYTAKSAEYGMVSLLLLIAMISLNLGLVNLFPIPLLDGGHLLYYALQAIHGKPLPRKLQVIGFKIGFAVLISIMVFATWNDIKNLLWK
ncbi:regulator of sigma E protease [Alphaproteobacteria bacterium]